MRRARRGRRARRARRVVRAELRARARRRNIFGGAGDCALRSCVAGYITPPCAQTVGSWLFWVLFIVIVVTVVTVVTVIIMIFKN